MDLLDLALQHKWPAFAAAAIGLLVRLLKSPAVPYPLSEIPAKARPLVALLLGLASGVLEHVASGTPWPVALANGAASAAFAVLSHDVVVEYLRGGKELGHKPADSELDTVPPVEVPPDTQRNA
jgi:hypothetical protein